MSIRLIALDLDGTLLDEQKQLPERNKRALKACIEQGIYVVPCTGRIAIGIPEIIRELPGVRYAVTVNGGTLVDMEEQRILDEKLISPQIVLEIYDLLKEYHVMCDAYIQGDGFSERYCFEHMDEYGIPEVVQKLVRQTRTPIDDMRSYIHDRNCMVDKLNLFFSDKEERSQIRRKLEERGDVLVSSSFPYNKISNISLLYSIILLSPENDLFQKFKSVPVNAQSLQHAIFPASSATFPV